MQLCGAIYPDYQQQRGVPTMPTQGELQYKGHASWRRATVQSMPTQGESQSRPCQ